MAIRMFGQYRLESLLGRGGMGEVHEAYDTVRDRMVALKVLSTHLSGDEEFVARFRREARIAARLNDPHIVPTHDYGEIDGRLYLDMRLIVGEDLSMVLGREGKLSPERALAIIEQVAGALDTAHEDGLVHRDVKPSNVMLTTPRPGRPAFAYLGDFGIARSVVPSTGSALTGTGQTLGTLHYMAPERFMGQPIDHRVDVYALACMLYECLTGRRPFEGDEMVALMHGHVYRPPPRPSEAVPTLPHALDDVLVRGMAKDPADRFPTAGELATAGRQAIESVPDVASASTRPSPPPPPMPPPVPTPTPESRPTDRPGSSTAAQTAYRSDSSDPRNVGATLGHVFGSRVGSETVNQPDAPTRAAPPAPSPVPIRGRRRGPYLIAGAVAVALALTTTVIIISGGGGSETGPAVAANPSFAAGTTMARLAEAGAIKVGTKFDQPLLGLKGIDGTLAGFDVEIAKIITAKLGIEPGRIQFVEAPSKIREDLIQLKTVDLVVATYTINDARRQSVSFAGPYLVSGLDLMVRADDTAITGPESLRPTNARVCSVAGSVPAQVMKERYIDPARLVLFDVYAKCAEALRAGQVDVVTTDTVILAGLIDASGGAFKLVNNRFTEEPYGIGITKGDIAFCEFINQTLKEAEADGTYAAASRSTVGKIVPAVPPLPPPQACR